MLYTSCTHQGRSTAAVSDFPNWSQSDTTHDLRDSDRWIAVIKSMSALSNASLVTLKLLETQSYGKLYHKWHIDSLPLTTVLLLPSLHVSHFSPVSDELLRSVSLFYIDFKELPQRSLEPSARQLQWIHDSDFSIMPTLMPALLNNSTLRWNLHIMHIRTAWGQRDNLHLLYFSFNFQLYLYGAIS